MFDRPHQRAGCTLILIAVMTLTLSVRAHAAPATATSPAPPTSPDTDAPSSGPFPVSLYPDLSAEPASEVTAEADAADDPESQPLPVPEQEQQLLPLDDRAPSITNSSPTGSGSWILQTLTALGVVLALIFTLRAVLMRMTGTQAGVGGNRLVEVLARATIGHKTQVVFLKIHQRVIVAAQTPNGMDTLTTLDDPDEVAWLLGQVEAAKPVSITRSFRTVMQRFDKDYTPDEPSNRDTSEHDVDRTRDQLSGLLSRIRHLKDRER
ncbi:MAG: flagellar biosynthetic protein FliO [Phycisphaeraceae bacterium]